MHNRRAPLRAIETFVVAARALSLTVAAEQLGLTISAVSRRISDLELELGVDLFRRFNRRIELTSAGVAYLAGVGAALDRVQTETDDLRQDRSQKLVRLSTMPVFAAAWLLPRLLEFRALRPDIEVELETGPDLIDFTTSDVHAGIRFGDGRWAGLVADKLMDVELQPVCAPSLVAPLVGPVTPALLDRYVFLTLAVPFDLWGEWFASVGLAGYVPKRTKTYDSGQVVYEAASAGMGLAPGAHALVTPYLQSGRLVPAFDVPAVLSKNAYYLVYRQRDRNWPPLRALSRMLLESGARA